MDQHKDIYLKALQLIKADQWDAAHNLIDQYHSSSAYRIHAYLHRIEGDIWNADYWYRKAGIKRPDVSLEDEWDLIHQDVIRG